MEYKYWYATAISTYPTGYLRMPTMALAGMVFKKSTALSLGFTVNTGNPLVNTDSLVHYYLRAECYIKASKIPASKTSPIVGMDATFDIIPDCSSGSESMTFPSLSTVSYTIGNADVVTVLAQIVSSLLPSATSATNTGCPVLHGMEADLVTPSTFYSLLTASTPL
jgi:hypothetical protein